MAFLQLPFNSTSLPNALEYASEKQRNGDILIQQTEWDKENVQKILNDFQEPDVR